MHSAGFIAKYFLNLTDPDTSGDLISNLKLQKLLYYAQGFHLAAYDVPLFTEEIEAWVHGPVVRKVYGEYSRYGADAIPVPSGVDFSALLPDTQEFLNEVYRVYGQYSAWKLRNLTHEEPPWKEARERFGNLITHESMKEYFKTLLE